MNEPIDYNSFLKQLLDEYNAGTINCVTYTLKDAGLVDEDGMLTYSVSLTVNAYIVGGKELRASFSGSQCDEILQDILNAIGAEDAEID